VFNLPAETFWLIVPWPFIWVGLALIMYFRMKKEDDLEDEGEKNSQGEAGS
jgi:hypothetical protein